MVTKFSGKFAIIMLKKHREFCRCGLTHLDATPILKNRPNTYDAPCTLWGHRVHELNTLNWLKIRQRIT